MQTGDDIPRLLGNYEDWEGCEELSPVEELLENLDPTKRDEFTAGEMSRAKQRNIARRYRKELKREAKRRKQNGSS